MNDNLLVSIALCTYNGAKYLAEQLDTLVNQTYPDIEIVVVDDCSSDDTYNILSDYAARYPQLKVHQNETNLGYIKNFEKSISLTTGACIALADQDDIWAPDKIRLMVDAIGDNLLIYHDSEFINEQGDPLNKKISDVRHFYAGNDSRVFIFENCVSGHAILFKRELLNYLTTFNNVVIHDWWLAYAACNNGTIGYMSQVLVKYRQHQKASTNILRIERGDGKKKKESLQKIEKQLSITQAFAAYPYNNYQDFKQKLLALMEGRMHSYTSFGLAWFVFKNRGTLLYIQKKSFASKFNFAIKMAVGYKLKKLLA